MKIVCELPSYALLRQDQVRKIDECLEGILENLRKTESNAILYS